MPFWVADMDFPVPDFLLDAIRNRLTHPIIGYTEPPDELGQTFFRWALRKFDWAIDPDWLVWIHGVVPGLNLAVRSIGEDNDTIVIPTPIYPPFLKLAGNNHRKDLRVPLRCENNEWTMDMPALRDASRQAVCLTLCNPQNPTGRVYTTEELRTIATLCLETETILISDEIHWGLVLDESAKYVPIASLDHDIAHNTITLLSHTKTYNIPGLQCAVAVIPNPGLRERFETTLEKLFGSISPLAYAAAMAAYQDQSTWLPELQASLRANRDLLQSSVDSTNHFSMTHVEGTHLGWIDCRQLPLKNPARYLEAFGLGLSDGLDFDAPGFMRFNFAAPRSLVAKGLERLQLADECAFNPKS